MTAPTKVIKPSGIYWAGKQFNSVEFDLTPYLRVGAIPKNIHQGSFDMSPELVVDGHGVSTANVDFDVSPNLSISIPRNWIDADLSPELSVEAVAKYPRSVDFDLSPTLTADGYGVNGPAQDSITGMTTTVGSSFSQSHTSAPHSNVFVDIFVVGATVLTAPTYDGVTMPQLAHASSGTIHLYRFGLRDEAGGTRTIAWTNSQGAATNMACRSYTGVRTVGTSTTGLLTVAAGNRLLSPTSWPGGSSFYSHTIGVYFTVAETPVMNGTSVKRTDSKFPLWLSSLDLTPSNFAYNSSYHSAGGTWTALITTTPLS